MDFISTFATDFQMTATLSCLLSDKLWFSVFQIGLTTITIWAFLKMTVFAEASPVSGVIRGEKSRGLMLNAAPFLLTAIVSVVVSISSFPTDGKVFFYFLDVAEIVYLTAFNGWSTNKLIGLAAKYEKRDFNPHH